MQGIYQAYTYHISSAAIVLAFLVSQERLDASDLHLLRILSVLDTESLPTLGWGLPKFHSQSLTSYGRVPLYPCYLDGNTTSTIPYKYAGRQQQAFEFGCADGQGPASRRGSHVYEVNDWLWNFGRPQPRVGGLSVSKTERIRRRCRSEASRRSWETRKAHTMAADEI